MVCLSIAKIHHNFAIGAFWMCFHMRFADVRNTSHKLFRLADGCLAQLRLSEYSQCIVVVVSIPTRTLRPAVDEDLDPS